MARRGFAAAAKAELRDQVSMLRSAAPDRTWVNTPFEAGDVTTVAAAEAYERVLESGYTLMEEYLNSLVLR